MRELIRAFHTTQAYRHDRSDGFRLASGVWSADYVDCRLLMSHPHARRLVARLASRLIHHIPCTCVGGLELGSIAVSLVLSDYAYRAHPPQIWRTFVVRKQAKDHGLGKVIEGAVQPGDHALIVDDVLTSGGSLIKAVEAARTFGLHVEHALVIVDREEQNGCRQVEAAGITVHRLLTLSDLRVGDD